MSRNRRWTQSILCFVLAFILAFSGMTFPDGGRFAAETVEAEAAAAKLSVKKKTLKVGKSFTLKVKNAKKKYTFKSSDPSVAKVKTKKGKKTKITAVSEGKATITATLGDTVLKCVVTVKGGAVTVEATPTPVPVRSANTDSSSVFDLPVGGQLKLELSGKEVRRFYVFDSDAAYLSVTEDGLVTALKASNDPITVQIEDKSYYHYRCKINITGGSSGTEVSVSNPTPDPTKAPTPVPTAVPTATPVPTQTPVVTTPVPVPVTPTPTVQSSTPYIYPEQATLNVGDQLQLTLVGAEALDFFLPFEAEDAYYLDVTSDGLITAKNPVTEISVFCMASNGSMYACDIKILAAGSEIKVDENGIGSDGLGNRDHYDISKVSADVSLGATYGLLTSHTREPWQRTLEYTIEDERGFIKACRDALEHGVEEFTITYRGFSGDYWWNKFKERIYCYSDLSGYTADGYTGWYDDSARTITIKPAYKDVWKAVTYLRYTGYEVDDDIKKLLNAAMMMTNDAIAANPGDAKAILLYINNRICEMTTYTDPIPTESDCPQRDATGVFFYGDGVCESYTAALRLVLNILGLQNDTIVNKKGRHIWNRVMLDGTWYHIDVTWNDVEDTWHGGYYNAYFLLTENELIEKSTKNKDENDPERLDHLWYNFYH